MQNAASNYKDDDTGKTGYGGIAADGQKAFKNYKVQGPCISFLDCSRIQRVKRLKAMLTLTTAVVQTDAADGKVDWKNEAKGVFGDIKVKFT